MWMFVGVIEPVVVHMGMHGADLRQFFRLMGVHSIEVIGMIVTAPQVANVIVDDEQAFAVMPTGAENVVVLLTPGGLLLLAEAVPLAMLVLLDMCCHLWNGQGAITGGFEEEAKVDVHQAIEAELLVDP